MSPTSKISVLLLALFAAFTVGCGDSGEDFVITGNVNNNVNPPTTGNLTFQFTQAQAIAVPLGTETLEFVFFNSNGDEVFASDQAFADTITITNVPISAVEVEITARGAGRVPLAIVTDAVAVQGGTTVTVDLSDAIVTPVELTAISVSPNPVSLDVDGPLTAQLSVTGTFSNGDVIALDAETDAVLTFNGTDGTVASVSADGLVSAVGPGDTSVDVTADINGGSVTFSDVPITVAGPNETLGTLIVEPDSLTVNNQGLLGALGGLGAGGDLGSLGAFRVYFLPPGETDPAAAREVTQYAGVSFGNFFPDTVTADAFTYVYIDGDGIAVGTSPLGPTPAYGTTGTMTVTFIDPESPSNHIYTEAVQLVVGNPELIGVALTTDEALTLPNATAGFPIIVDAIYSNGVVLPTEPGTGANGMGDSFELAIDANASVSTDGTFLSTTFTNGSATVNVIANGGATPIDTFTVTNTNAVVREVSLSPGEILVNPVGNYRVTMEFSDGTTQDVTRIWTQLDYNSIDGSLATVGGILGPSSLGRLLGRDPGVGQLTIGTLFEVRDFMQNELGFPPGNEDFDAPNNTVVVNVEQIITGITGILFP